MMGPGENAPGRAAHRRDEPVFVNPNRTEGGRSGSLANVLNALRRVPGLEVAESSSIPPQCIAVADEVVAFIDDLDAWESASPAHGGESVEAIRRVSPRIIFKYQYRSGIDYLPGTVSAGYFCAEDIEDAPRDCLHRCRPVDVSARMRSAGYGHLRCDWKPIRGVVVAEAARLGREGYQTRIGKIDRGLYYRELFDTKIGLNWRGYGKLTYRMIEYARAGVVMITDPLGAIWPVREDIVLEDGVHCVYCDDAARFGEVAVSLLNDPARLASIRRNVVALWESKLCPEAMGAWYWAKLQDCLEPRLRHPASTGTPTVP
jgi:hypothetical protein